MSDKKQWFVYILECQDNSVYIGVTNDVDHRMKVHRSGKGSKYVARKRFKRLLHTIKAVDKVDACKLEYRIKQFSRNEKITFFINHPDRDFSVLHT